jgi:hypothetical protein
MLLTEEEARKKWCPHTRVFARGGDFHDSGLTSANRTGKGAKIAGSCCIASECMSWRWGVQTDRGTAYAFASEQMARNACAENDRLGGYCGLAEIPS